MFYRYMSCLVSEHLSNSGQIWSKDNKWIHPKKLKHVAREKGGTYKQNNINHNLLVY